jgi:CubicO group peptidase (beta-lactamase class C family)
MKSHGALQLGIVLMSLASVTDEGPAEYPVYPASDWERREPENVGLSIDKLKELAKLVGGRGCVVRHGYLVYTWGDPAKSGDIASAVKPVISTLLLMAVQHGKIKSVDTKLAEFEPRLRALNNGKDASITWRHFASQTSGYGLSEMPGEAYAYNDFALALCYDTLTRQVYHQDGTRLLKEQLGDLLGFQDRYTFEAFGPDDRPGRLAISRHRHQENPRRHCPVGKGNRQEPIRLGRLVVYARRAKP